MADFLNQVFQHSLPIDQKLDLIRSNRDFNSIYQDNKYHDVFQSQINSLLSSPARRVHGFLLLEEYLSEMPKELLGENFKNWASFCVSYIEGSNWNGKNIALSLLDKLLLTGHSDDNTRRKLSLHVISQIVDYICRNNHIVEKCDPSMVFKVLLTCVTKYSGSCGSKKYIICTFINKNIHSCANGFKTLTAILAYIHYCPTPGQSNLTLKSSWYDHFCACIDNMNSALDRLMSWGVPFESLKITDKKLPVLLNVTEKENFTGRLKLEQSFKALASVACNMMKDTAVTGCLIPVSCVLQLIGRASSVKLDSLYLRDPGLALTVFSVQLQSLRLLEQLISSLRTILTCWSKYIYQSIIGIMDNALTTNETPSTSSTTSIAPPKLSTFTLKNQCYRLLDKWFTLTGPNVSIDRETADSLLKNFMIDMKHSDNNIELRNIKKTKSREPNQTRPIVQENLIKLHFSCLKACNSFIRNCFMFLPSDQMTFFATFIIEEELSLYKKSLSSSLFYGNPETRKELISLIVILCQEDETIPIGVTLRILEKVLMVDQSSLVREFCLQSLRSLNGLINPVRILRTKEATTSNPFPFEAIDSAESVPNLPENTIIGNENVSNNNDQEEEDGEIIDKSHEDMNQKPINKPLKQDLNKSSDSKSSSTDGTKTDTIQKGDDDDELIEFNCSEDEGKTSDVIMIPEDEKENGNSDKNADCIVYDVESGDTMKTMKLADDSAEKDDDLEIVSFSPALTIIKRDGDYNSSSPNKKPKIVQEDCHSQSSSRSLTIIEPTPDIHEIGESSGEINTEIDNDIIKDFVAN